MAKKMKIKFFKHWDEYSLILTMRTILDPKLKLQILITTYDKVDRRTAEKKLKLLKRI